MTLPPPARPARARRPHVLASFALLVGALALRPDVAGGQIVDPRIEALVSDVSAERLHEYLSVLTAFETRHSLSLSDRDDWGVRRLVSTSWRP